LAAGAPEGARREGAAPRISRNLILLKWMMDENQIKIQITNNDNVCIQLG
jgi:hypothetical protein